MKRRMAKKRMKQFIDGKCDVLNYKGTRLGRTEMQPHLVFTQVFAFWRHTLLLDDTQLRIYFHEAFVSGLRRKMGKPCRFNLQRFACTVGKEL